MMPMSLRPFLIGAYSLIATALVTEALLRLFVPMSAVPHYAHHPILGLHYEPNQQGCFYRGTGTLLSCYSINDAGWNATHDYTPGRSDAYRIAVIGDSQVEAMPVMPEEGFTETLWRTLEREGVCRQVEVLRLGMAGAPMSQYSVTMRHAQETYQPDYFVVHLSANDFDPSLIGAVYQGNRHFWQYDPNSLELVSPVVYSPDYYRRAIYAQVYLLHFLTFNVNIGNAGRTPPAEAEFPVETIEAMTRRGLIQMQTEADGSPLLLTMAQDPGLRNDGALHEPYARGYFEMVQQIADELGIAFLDVSEALTQDWNAYQLPLERPNDSHWNPRGSEVVGRALASRLLPGLRDTRCEGK